MKKRSFTALLCSVVIVSTLAGCSSTPSGSSSPSTEPENEPYESVEDQQIRMTAGDVEVMIMLNGTRSAADLAAMLPLELQLIERNSFAKGMTLPERLSGEEPVTREYEIGDFGYWAAGPDLAIFYDDIYEQTIVEIIPLGHAAEGAEEMASVSGTVRLELISELAE